MKLARQMCTRTGRMREGSQFSCCYMQGSGLCGQAIHDVWRCIQGRPSEGIQQGRWRGDISVHRWQYTRSCSVTLVLHDEAFA